MATLASGFGAPGGEARTMPIGAAATEQLVDRTFEVKGAECIHRAGGSARYPRFACRLPDLRGEMEIRVAPDRQRFTLVRRSVHLAVAAESSAGRRVAGLLDSWGRVSHAVCARRTAKTFECPARFVEPGYGADVVVALELRKRGRIFVSGCRLTRLGPEPGAPLACQHLWWNVNLPMATAEGLEEEARHTG